MERICRILYPDFLAIKMMDLWLAKIWAPLRVRNEPDIFIFTFIILRFCSTRLLVKGTSKSVRNCSVSVLNVFSLPGDFGLRVVWSVRVRQLLLGFGQFTMK